MSVTAFKSNPSCILWSEVSSSPYSELSSFNKIHFKMTKENLVSKSTFQINVAFIGLQPTHLFNLAKLTWPCNMNPGDEIVAK